MGARHDRPAENRHRHAQIVAEGGLFIIRSFSRDLDARLAESVLDANGIESIVIADNAAGMMPYFNAFHPIRLAVKEADVEQALALLGEE
jgi:hypothetical protein